MDKTELSGKFYVMIVLISFLVIVLALDLDCMLENHSRISDVFIGLGTGGVSSLIISWLIDLERTKSKGKEDKDIYDCLNLDFRTSCEDLLTESVIAVQSALEIDYEKRTLIQWMEMILKDDDADKKTLSEADYALQQISVILKEAERLIDYAKIHISNKYFDENYIKRVERVRNICTRIRREHKLGKYNNCLSFIAHEYINAIDAYDPKIKGFYLTPFNWEEE